MSTHIPEPEDTQQPTEEPTDQPDQVETPDEQIVPDLTSEEAGEQPTAEGEPTSAQEDSEDAPKPDADDAPEDDEEDDKKDEPDITNPGKLVRLGHMHAKLLEELKNSESDPAGRKRLAQIHEATIDAMKEALGQDLEDEFLSYTPKLSSYSTPSHSELLLAQAGLVGWIEGLLQSIQTAIMARQAMHEETPHHPDHPVKHAPDGTYGPGNYL